MAFVFIFCVVGALFSQVSCKPGVDRHTNVGIIGGHTIPIEKAPFMASLRIPDAPKEFAHFCGGSIIHERWILTAAHCVTMCCSTDKPNFKVLVGTENINGDDGELFEIDDVIVHSGFDNKTGDFDVALVKLKESLTFGPKVGKIALAHPFIEYELPTDVKLNSTGWGLTESDERPSKLLQVEIPMITRRKCSELYGLIKKNITSNMICAGSDGHQPYRGDSGGPLTLDDVQVGIVSFGMCFGKLAAVFTNVASIVCWVLEKLQANPINV